MDKGRKMYTIHESGYMGHIVRVFMSAQDRNLALKEMNNQERKHINDV